MLQQSSDVAIIVPSPSASSKLVRAAGSRCGLRGDQSKLGGVSLASRLFPYRCKRALPSTLCRFASPLPVLHRHWSSTDRTMSEKRKRDDGAPVPDYRPGKKQKQKQQRFQQKPRKHGFVVGPANLPDGTYKRKSTHHHHHHEASC